MVKMPRIDQLALRKGDKVRAKWPFYYNSDIVVLPPYNSQSLVKGFAVSVPNEFSLAEIVMVGEDKTIVKFMNDYKLIRIEGNNTEYELLCQAGQTHVFPKDYDGFYRTLKSPIEILETFMRELD